MLSWVAPNPPWEAAAAAVWCFAFGGLQPFCGKGHLHLLLHEQTCEDATALVCRTSPPSTGEPKYLGHHSGAQACTWDLSFGWSSPPHAVCDEMENRVKLPETQLLVALFRAASVSHRSPESYQQVPGINLQLGLIRLVSTEYSSRKGQTSLLQCVYAEGVFVKNIFYVLVWRLFCPGEFKQSCCQLWLSEVLCSSTAWLGCAVLGKCNLKFLVFSISKLLIDVV